MQGLSASSISGNTGNTLELPQNAVRLSGFEIAVVSGWRGACSCNSWAAAAMLPLLHGFNDFGFSERSVALPRLSKGSPDDGPLKHQMCFHWG